MGFFMELAIESCHQLLINKFPLREKYGCQELTDKLDMRKILVIQDSELIHIGLLKLFRNIVVLMNPS